MKHQDNDNTESNCHLSLPANLSISTATNYLCDCHDHLSKLPNLGCDEAKLTLDKCHTLEKTILSMAPQTKEELAVQLLLSHHYLHENDIQVKTNILVATGYTKQTLKRALAHLDIEEGSYLPLDRLFRVYTVVDRAEIEKHSFKRAS